MKPLQLAVVGTGHLGRIHARLAGQLEGVCLIGVVDPVPGVAAAVAREVGAKAYTHHRDVADQVDAAIVAASTPSHHALVLDLLTRGIHCLVEKPITVTVDQADELIAAAERHSAVLAVGHVERFNPALAAAADHIAGAKYIEATRAGGYTFRSTDVGVVLDLMIHDLDVILSLVGSPLERVDALGLEVFGPHEDMAQARLVFQNGCVANLAASRSSYEAARRMKVFSESGYAEIDFGSRKAKVIHPCAAVMHRQIDVDALSEAEKTDLREKLFTEVLPLEEIVPDDANPLLDEQRDFVEAVRTGRRPRVPGSEGREALAAACRVLDAIAAHRQATSPAGRDDAHDEGAEHRVHVAHESAMRKPHWQRAGVPDSREVRKAG